MSTSWSLPSIPPLIPSLSPCAPPFHTPPARLPHPDDCQLYYVERDTLFSFHAASETFLQRMMSLYVASHYKNSPNDLLLMADAPAHHLFVLLGPVAPDARALPDVLAVVQVALEGAISARSARASLAAGQLPQGDLIPWTVGQQFQDADFPALSGARVVRIATHPEVVRAGYGSRAMDLLRQYYEGGLAELASDDEGGAGGGAGGGAASSRAAAGDRAAQGRGWGPWAGARRVGAGACAGCGGLKSWAPGRWGTDAMGPGPEVQGAPGSRVSPTQPRALSSLHALQPPPPCPQQPRPPHIITNQQPGRCWRKSWRRAPACPRCWSLCRTGPPSRCTTWGFPAA